MEKLGGQKKGPRKTSTPKKKPQQVQLPFAAGSKRALQVALYTISVASSCSKA